jgi:DNA end-binding protein Ku
MASRYYWKGYLKLSLVSCPIALTPAASSSEKVSFRQINKKTGNRIRYQYVDGETGEPVEQGDRGKGYEVGKNEYLMVDDEELEAIQLESTHTIDIDRFVPAAQIDKRFYDNPYYIVPNDTVGQEAFAVIRDAMKGKNVVALGRIVLNKRERVIAIEPYDKGLLGTTLRYAYEVRKPDEHFEDISDIKVPAEMLKLAEHIVETKEGDFEPEAFKDHYEDALVELLRKKQAHVPLKKTAERAAAPRNVINLMDALRRSIAGVETPAKGKKAKKGSAGQREMLLPISGKKGKEAPKEAVRSGGRRKAG